MTNADKVTYIVSGEAGSLFDKIGRSIERELSQALDAPIFVQNAGDSSGVGGAEAGAAAAADGRTIVMCNKGAMTSHPHTAKTYSSDDFIPLCQLAEAPIVIAVRSDGPYDTLASLLTAAKDARREISFSTPNPYHTQRLALASFAHHNGLTFKYVQLPGSNAVAIQNLVEGKVDFAFLAAHNLVDARNARQIRILAVAHPSRLNFLPNDPTFREQGYDFVTAIWLGLFARAGSPPTAVNRLRAAAERAAGSPEVAARIDALQWVPAYVESKAFAEKFASDTRFHLEVLRQLGAVS